MRSKFGTPQLLEEERIQSLRGSAQSNFGQPVPSNPIIEVVGGGGGLEKIHSGLGVVGRFVGLGFGRWIVWTWKWWLRCRVGYSERVSFVVCSSKVVSNVVAVWDFP